MKVANIFVSLDGEVTLNGPLQWAVFFRTQVCNLRFWKSSGFCDTPHALRLSGNVREFSPEDLASVVSSLGPRRCTITGGEPLLWKEEILELSRRLCSERFVISLETSGSIMMTDTDVNHFDCVIMDLKPPSTEMVDHNILANLEVLRVQDYLKVVVSNEGDLDWLTSVLDQCGYTRRRVHFNIAIGPRLLKPGVYAIQPSELVEWMRRKSLWHWSLNLQLHKVIWPESVTPLLPEGVSPESMSEDIIKACKEAER